MAFAKEDGYCSKELSREDAATLLALFNADESADSVGAEPVDIATEDGDGVKELIRVDSATLWAPFNADEIAELMDLAIEDLADSTGTTETPASDVREFNSNPRERLDCGMAVV